MSIYARSILFSALILWILPNSLFPQYSQTIYDIEDGLTHNTVLDITSDENGFIWVFTTAGVCRFDGHRFREYKVDLNIRQQAIIAEGRFMNDSRNRIWIESALPALLLYNNEQDRIQVVKEVQYTDFYDLADDGNGNIIFTSLANPLLSPILQLKEGLDYTFTDWEFNVPEEFRMIYYIHRFADGTMIASGTNGLYKMEIHEGSPHFDRIELVNTQDNSDYKAEEPLHFLCDDNSFYLFNRHEILCTGISGNDSFRDSVIEVEPFLLNFPEIGLVPGQPLFSVIRDRKGGLFLRSLNGIYRFNPKKRSVERIRDESYGEKDDGEGDFRGGLYLDDRGILWAGTDHGLLKIVFGNKPFHTISPEPDHPGSLTNGKLRSVLKDSRGGLWVGTVAGGLFHSIPDSGGQFKSFTNYQADAENPSSYKQ